MTDTSAQGQKETLDRILTELRSDDESRILAAIAELGTIGFSSAAILRQLKLLAVGKVVAVREAALKALDLRTSIFVESKLSTLVKTDRAIVLTEIGAWQKDGLIEPHRAEVLRKQYDFDTRTSASARVAPPVAEKEMPATPTAEPEAVPPVKAEAAAPVPQQVMPKTAAPKQSLAQTIFSETAIKIYLYLGPLFVIVAAAIWAINDEVARLPVLLLVTALFAGFAVGIRKRLPQPSFALSIVFSFLLPIDANVLADSLTLSARGNDIYWTVVFLFMAVIWALGTWLYASRLFSVASFFSLILTALRFSEIFNAPSDWNIFSVAIANMAGLLAVRFLKNWKDQKFAQPLFLLTQLLQLIVLGSSFMSVIVGSIDVGLTSGSWIAATLTWLLAASFYVASDLLIPFVLFPWMAVASLFLVPWMSLSAFDASAPAQAIGFAVWGVVHALASEFVVGIGVRRLQSSENQSQETLDSASKINKYHYPLLAWSMPLFLLAIGLGLAEDTWYGFISFLAAAIAYTAINIMRPRWYVWATALLAGLGAYFTFFGLPRIWELRIDTPYQLLGASVLLLVPELFFREKFSFQRSWSWPPILLGIALTMTNLLISLGEIGFGEYGQPAIVYGVTALLAAAYALRFKEARIGYIGTFAAAMSVAFAFQHFNNYDLLLPLTALSVVYYAAGFGLARRESLKPWGMMLILSVLVLGGYVTLRGLVADEAGRGWYVLVVAVFYAVEMFTRRNAFLEIFVGAILNVSLILVMDGFNVNEVVYHLFGSSLLWLTCDAILHRAFANRKLHFLTRIIGGILTLVTGTLFFSGELTSGIAATCFAVYTAFFAAYALNFRQPVFGYLSTASATATLLFTITHFKIETWFPLFIALAAGYYVAGFFLRARLPGWAEMLRYSGLIVGSLFSFVAVGQQDPGSGWYTTVIGTMFVVEMFASRNGWFEAGAHILFSAAAFLILSDFEVDIRSYHMLTYSLLWLTGDMLFEYSFKERKLSLPVRVFGHLIAGFNAVGFMIEDPAIEAGIGFGVYAVFYAIYTAFYQKPNIGYASTASLALAVFYGLRAAEQRHWVLPLIAVAVVYYAAGYFLRRADKAKGWDTMLLFSGLGLGTLVALASPFQDGGLELSIPIAIAATFYAAEAFARRNVWLGFPANILYLLAYFVILFELNVDEPQFFTVGAAALGLFQHYLLRRAGQKSAAFITGLVSQLVLLGASYSQMIDTGNINYFFLLFFQALAVLAYGIVVRSRSLIIAPIGFAVLAVITVLYNALKDLSLVFIIGIAGLILISLGILAVVMRERITDMADRFSDWDA